MVENRRPLASRQTDWAQRITQWLATTSVTPNQISIGSIVAAIAAALCLIAAFNSDYAYRSLLLVFAALCCQLRLLCNLFDGMVAVEAGKRAPDGPAWNEFPDRFADLAIFVGAGIAVGEPALGWAAGSFAILTAYVRELGAANGLAHDFSGPMAKQHRMAVISIASVIAALGFVLQPLEMAVEIALWIVVLGSLATALRRIVSLVKTLNDQG